jgi:hypothetical protein
MQGKDLFFEPAEVSFSHHGSATGQQIKPYLNESGENDVRPTVHSHATRQVRMIPQGAKLKLEVCD